MSTRNNKKQFVNIGEEAPAPTLKNWIKYFTSSPPKQQAPLKNIVENYENMPDNSYAWFGHSTVLFRICNKFILIDPVFFKINGARNFKYEYNYDIASFPFIDYLILTHNHFDHMNLPTLKLLKNKVGKVITPLNNYKYIQKYFRREQVIEIDWFQSYIEADLYIKCLPAQHYSARTCCDKKYALWASFQINNIFLSGDTEYCQQITQIIQENLFMPVKFCFIESNLYNEGWGQNHCNPQNAHKIFTEINGQILIPIHFGKYNLSKYSWNEPVTELNKICNDIVVGQIGKIYLFEQISESKLPSIASVWETL
ncbi:Beta-lactamase_superfamily domain-containing protein [Hexamita inflata]|uniref:Beta-lactamase superfamily domain-containing protein n=1 Tax=Hexamita inflata TaxID=28002 RepID=A0AA86TYU5_9EUKA|nr:Beta-lactamase superfamily domain-containing protein [Hexamita inflata]CAI9974178.1 Beta-lactamase superfamily domain-containing protein [Hexamita inflata]